MDQDDVQKAGDLVKARQRELTSCLYALREEAAHAWKQSMSGELPSDNLARSWRNVETLIAQLTKEGS